MDKITFEERNLIIDQVIDDMKKDHKNGLYVSICESLDHVLGCYHGCYPIFSVDQFKFLDIPILGKLGFFWWNMYDLNSRIQFLKANKSAI